MGVQRLRIESTSYMNKLQRLQRRYFSKLATTLHDVIVLFLLFFSDVIIFYNGRQCGFTVLALQAAQCLVILLAMQEANYIVRVHARRAY